MADDVTTRHAQNAPQKKAEGLATVYKGDNSTRAAPAGNFDYDSGAQDQGVYESAPAEVRAGFSFCFVFFCFCVACSRSIDAFL